MSYLHGNLSTAQPRFDDLQDRALGSLASMRRDAARKLSRMSPQQKKAYALAIRQAVSQMTPQQRHLYENLMHRQRIEGPSHPRQLGFDWSMVGDVTGGILEGAAAIGTVYLAYEGMEAQKDERRAQRRLEEKRLDQEAKLLEQQLEERRTNLAREQEEWRRRQAQEPRQGGAGAAGGMNTKTKVAIGAGAAVAAVALTQM